MSSDLRKKRDYKKYKLYQRKHEKTLSIAEDATLNTLTITNLLLNYSIVKRMYKQRSDYRLKYFKRDQWDEGHQQFIDYLLKILNSYRSTLQNKYQLAQKEKPKEEQIEQQEEPTEQKEQPIHKIRKISEKLDMIMKEEKEIWNSKIPQLIIERKQVTDEFTRELLTLKDFCHKLFPEIDEIQFIDIIRFFLECHHQSNIKVQATDGHMFSSTFINSPPLTLEEFVIKYLNSATFIIKNIIKYLPTVASQDLAIFKNLIQNILDAIPSTHKYHIINIVVFNKLNVFIPSATIKFSSITTTGKSFFLFRLDSRSFSVAQLEGELFSNTYRRLSKPHRV